MGSVVDSRAVQLVLPNSLCKVVRWLSIGHMNWIIILGEERSFGTTIGGGKKLWHYYWVRGNVLALLLWEERSVGAAIGGRAIQNSYWGRGEAPAHLLGEERSSGTAFGEERSFGTAIRGRREAPALLFGGGAPLHKAKPKQTTHVKLVTRIISTTLIIQFHNKRLLMYKLDYKLKKILT